MLSSTTVVSSGLGREAWKGQPMGCVNLNWYLPSTPCVNEEVFWSILEHMGQGAWRDLAHGRSSTGYAKEEGRSHLEDQLDRLLDQPVEFLNSTGQASTRSS
ncbi:unnamed protein product [Microthlaspi erraticum]|uniref:Uncharacterized protein n=1 Tax=Microthlaspi erraticum TaxID=1685480 RepID=A0A6D2JVW6_9BRAS|nr:unnamed protein product [Microthlaspi erraticum]